MITQQDKRLIQENVGNLVTIENHAHAEMSDGMVGLNFAGKLEHDPDENFFFVRVGNEDYHAGAMGVSFGYQHVFSVDLRPSNRELRIVLN